MGSKIYNRVGDPDGGDEQPAPAGSGADAKPVFDNDFANRILDNLPSAMLSALEDAATAGEAEEIFSAWHNRHPVPYAFRGFVWCNA